MAIEVELRAFVSVTQYNSVADWLRKKGWNGKTLKQVTFYLESSADARIEIMKAGGSMRQKLGVIHEIDREELEVDLTRQQAEALLNIFKNLGIKFRAVWFRERAQFQWEDMKLCLDDTIGYNRIFEVEKVVTVSEDVDSAKEKIKKTMSELGLHPTPMPDQDAAYRDYLTHWGERTKGLTLSWVDS